jgi:hypothetical protein
MPYIQRKRRGYVVWMKVRPFVFGLLAVSFLVGLWWGVSQIGPRKLGGNTPPVSIRATDPKLLAMQAEVLDLQSRYQSAGQGADPELMIKAGEIQRQVVARTEGGGQAEMRLLEDLDRELDAINARTKNLNIRELDTQGRIAQDSRDLAAAEVAWTEALSLQREVNRSGASGALKNFRKEAEFEQRIQGLAAAPLAQEITEALEVARREASAGNWAEALGAYAAARDAQVRVNVEFPRSAFADSLKLDRIEREVETLDAANLSAEVVEFEKSGDAAMNAEDFEGATELFERARQLQLRINQEFARSQFLSSVRVQDLEVKRQTAASVLLIREIAREAEGIDVLLRQRKTVQAGETIMATDAKLRAGFDRLKRSERWNPALQLRLSYLASQRDRLAEIQDAIYERLRPLPGVSEIRILRTEFPQSLYQQVMKSNPSRNPGRAFPVDSVNWLEAEKCCERLSWILGRTVRLPTVDEFRIAIADTASGDVIGDRKDSQAMASGEPNAAGLYDLLGNLAEWLNAAPSEMGGAPAPIAGGSYLDKPEALLDVIQSEMPRSDRARHVGFRIVMEFETVE